MDEKTKSLKAGRTAAALLAILLLSSALAIMATADATTTISIPDVEVASGVNTTVPIMINDVTDPDGVGTVYINLTYDPSVVNVVSVSDANSDFSMVVPNIGDGYTTIGASYFGVAPGPTGDVYLVDVTLEAVGGPGDTTPLSITIVELLDAAPSQNPISATPDDGTFTIQADVTAPIIKAEPVIIPEDTDGVPLWGEMSTIDATDDSAISTITVNLSAMGGSPITYMSNAGNYSDGTLWCVFNVTNVSVGTAKWNATSETYEPYYLSVNATDIYSTSNTSVSIELTVMKNGDVNEEGSVSFGDVTYLGNHVLGTLGYDIQECICDVNGDGSVSFGDVTYLGNHILGTLGYGTLK